MKCCSINSRLIRGGETGSLIGCCYQKTDQQERWTDNPAMTVSNYHPPPSSSPPADTHTHTHIESHALRGASQPEESSTHTNGQKMAASREKDFFWVFLALHTMWASGKIRCTSSMSAHHLHPCKLCSSCKIYMATYLCSLVSVFYSSAPLTLIKAAALLHLLGPAGGQTRGAGRFYWCVLKKNRGSPWHDLQRFASQPSLLFIYVPDSASTKVKTLYSLINHV